MTEKTRPNSIDSWRGTTAFHQPAERRRERSQKNALNQRERERKKHL